MTTMKRFSGDMWLAIGLLLVLVIIVVVAVLQKSGDEQLPPLASFSSQPDGARMLDLWLDDIGYSTSHNVANFFSVPDNTDIVMLLEPTTRFTNAEWNALDRWVERGGLLIIAGERPTMFAIANHYDLNRGLLPNDVIATTPQNPLFNSPPLRADPTLPTFSVLQSQRDDLTVHLVAAGQPVLISFAQGDGTVFFSSSAHLFSNAGLPQAANGELVLNILSRAGRDSSLWFDEWHHGVRTSQDADQVFGLQDWLRTQPSGRALLFVGLLVFIALLLRGQIFGRPLPVENNTARRAPLEYIIAIANLNRRAGHRGAVMARYHARLKRDLGKRYRLDPTLPDTQFANTMATYNPAIDEIALNRLLAALNNPAVSESQMVVLAAEVADWLSR